LRLSPIEGHQEKHLLGESKPEDYEETDLKGFPEEGLGLHFREGRGKWVWKRRADLEGGGGEGPLP